MKTILVVDDERGSRESLKAVFSNEYSVLLAESAEEARDKLSETKIDLLILDVVMPKKGGLEFLKDVNSLYPAMPVVMVSASTSVRPVVEAMRIGAHDFVTKPFDVDELRRIVKRVVKTSALNRRVETLQTEVAREFPVQEIVGKSPVFTNSIDELKKAAETDSTVLILGESGTGKELAARLVHSASNRRDEPFIAVHCSALPETLMESELFGHEKGSFTNATKQKQGRFDLAGSGTLFFDELGEMSLAMQVKLLRVLQEREFMRVGGTRIIKTNARIVAATSKDLRKQVDKGEFRDDLFFRISVVPVTMPPVRERTGDIPLLIQYFFENLKQNINAATTGFDSKAMDLLCEYSWPGNVRELRNIVERMLVLYGKEKEISSRFLPSEFHENENSQISPEFSAKSTLQDSVSAYEKSLIEDALNKTNGVQTQAAKMLGTTRRILRYRMEKLDLRNGSVESD